MRLAAQRHVGFFGAIVAFFGVALFARRYQVHPGIATSAGAGCYVVYGKLLLGATILALIVIALEYILPGKINALVRGVNISIQSYYRGHREALTHRVQLIAVRGSHQFAFV